MFKRKKLGQSTAEYAIVIGLVIAAVVAMQIYVKRGIQAKIADATDARVTINAGANETDFSGNMFGVNTVAMYEPNYTESPNMVSTKNVIETQTFNRGAVNRTITGNETTSSSGVQTTLSPAEANNP